MTISQSETERLLAELCREPRETSWLEFKENRAIPDDIAEYVSALSNAAVLAERGVAYMVWGVQDSDHRVVGTSFDPYNTKQGNEDLIPWLARVLEPQVTTTFKRVDVGGLTVWILEIGAARTQPVAFKGKRYIRVGSYKKPLAEHPDHERRLWRAFEHEVFETGVAADRLTEQDVLSSLDYSAYFTLMNLPFPSSRSEIIDHLVARKLVRPSTVGWAITNLGAVLFARNLEDFDNVQRKRVRVIRYSGNDRVNTVHEQPGSLGYAAGFAGMLTYINGQLPRHEVIGEALRDQRVQYPEIAIRELAANMLIHQDFSMTGTGPLVEIFADRIEFTNPGVPVIDPMRFVDMPARSRNEKLAGMMHIARICEERGSGWDKVALQTEAAGLPAPRVDVTEDHTRAVLLGPQPLTRMARADRVYAVYLHASLKWVKLQRATNSSVRERFGIAESSKAQASRLLNEALEDGLIAVYDDQVGYRSRQYVPYWAAAR